MFDRFERGLTIGMALVVGGLLLLAFGCSSLARAIGGETPTDHDRRCDYAYLFVMNVRNDESLTADEDGIIYETAENALQMAEDLGYWYDENCFGANPRLP
jgi:hypothetical protein